MISLPIKIFGGGFGDVAEWASSWTCMWASCGDGEDVFARGGECCGGNLEKLTARSSSQKLQAKKEGIVTRDLEEQQAMQLGLYNLLDADLNDKDSQSGTLKQALNKAIARVKKGLGILHEREKEVVQRTQENDDQFAVVLSDALRKFILELKEEGVSSPKDLFVGVRELRADKNFSECFP